MRILAGAVWTVTVLSLASGAPGGGAPRSSTVLVAGPERSAGSAPAGVQEQGAAPPPVATPLTSRAVRAAVKSARAAVSSGRVADGLKGYESVLASSASSGKSRAEALYWAGMLRLSPDPALRDIDRARAWLGELKVFHGEDRRQDEVAIFLSLTEELGDLHRGAQSVRTELEAMDRDREACRLEKVEAADKVVALTSENQSLKDAESAHRAEILSLRDEIKRKDEALRKVKEVVVGWKTPR
jgi:hypothetical protein